MTGNTIVLDACLVITFGNVEAFEIVAQLRRHRVTISRRAAAEVTRPPALDQLNSAIEHGLVAVEQIDLDAGDEQEALARFDNSPRFRGRGDAEVLALAISRGWIVGSDETAVRRAAQSEIGAARVAGSLDFLRWAVIERRITTAQAVALLGRVDVGSGLLQRIEASGQTPEELFDGG